MDQFRTFKYPICSSVVPMSKVIRWFLIAVDFTTWDSSLLKWAFEIESPTFFSCIERQLLELYASLAVLAVKDMLWTRHNSFPFSFLEITIKIEKKQCILSFYCNFSIHGMILEFLLVRRLCFHVHLFPVARENTVFFGYEATAHSFIHDVLMVQYGPTATLQMQRSVVYICHVKVERGIRWSAHKCKTK